MDILWLDDDADMKLQGEYSDGVKIFCAKNCYDAVFLLENKKIRPEWAVVDLRVPQKGWMDQKILYDKPGIEFLNYVKKSHPGMNTVVYCNYADNRTKDLVERAGAKNVFLKENWSFDSVISNLSYES